MIETPQITEFGPQQIAMIRLTVPAAEIQKVMGPGFMEIMGVLAAQGIAPTGPWFTRHVRDPGAVFDFAICVPVGKAVEPSGRVEPGELPATRVARTVLHGNYSGLANGWKELRAWIATQGHARQEGLLERYVKGPESSEDPADWRTELIQPLA